MTIHTKVMWQITTLLVLVSMTGCGSAVGMHPVERVVALPTAPATLPEIIAALSSDSPGARITAAGALRGFGEEAVAAIPALIQNLHYERHHDVRRAAAIALGELGSEARSAVPALTDVLQSYDAVPVRRAAADALGRIGDSSAVPVLASILYEEVIEGTCEELVSRYPDDCRLDSNSRSCSCGGEIGRTMGHGDEGLMVEAAVAIALITGEKFPDADSSGGYRLDEDGVPLIITAAREWWESEGQYQKWPAINSDE